MCSDVLLRAEFNCLRYTVNNTYTIIFDVDNVEKL